MDHLRGDLAPITDAAWAAIEQEAERTLRHFLAGRALVDVADPVGWTYSARGTGRTDPAQVDGGVAISVRQVQPVIELRTPFELAIAELDAVDRGALDPDLAPLIAAARQAAAAEDRAIFYGNEAGGAPGIASASPHEPLLISDDYDEYPRVVARAVARLREAGISGPFGLALGPRCFTGVIETTEHGGYPVLEHIRTILGGPVVWAPAVDGAVVVSRRGGDHLLVPGQDFAIGYQRSDEQTVQLYLEESFTFTVVEPLAAVALVYPS